MPAPTLRQCTVGAAIAGALLALAACAPWPLASAQASDAGAAPITIDMARAQSGGISRGDTPGFPVTLTTPGHYRLTGDLVVPAHQAGIVIAAPGITLDLNGFTVRAVPACAAEDAACRAQPHASAHGIHIGAKARQAIVRNGQVSGFAGSGVVVDTEARLEDLQSQNNHGSGLHANTSANRPVQVHRVTALRNGFDGFWLQTGNVTQSRAEANGRNGFALGALMQWEECSAQGNRDIDGDALPSRHASVPVRRQRAAG